MKRFIIFAAGLLLLLPAVPALAQFGQFTQGPASGGGGGNPYTLQDHGHCAAAGGCSVTGLNLAGANLIVVNIFQFQGSPTSSPGDTIGNVYQPGTCKAAATVAYNCLYYIINPNVTGPLTTITCASGGGVFGGCEVAVFTRTGGAPVFDAQNGAVNSSAGTTLQPGSITPAQSSELFIAGVCYGNDTPTSTYTINSSYTVTDFDPYATGVSEGGGLAYLLPTNSSAQNPTWTDSSTYLDAASTGMAFK